MTTEKNKSKKEKKIIRHILRFPNQHGFGFCPVVDDVLQLSAHGVLVEPGELLTVIKRLDLCNDNYGTEYAARLHTAIVTCATRLYKLKMPYSPMVSDDFLEAETELEATGKISGYLVLTSINTKLIWISDYDYIKLLAFPVSR